MRSVSGCPIIQQQVDLATPRILHCADIGQRPELDRITPAFVRIPAPPRGADPPRGPAFAAVPGGLVRRIAADQPHAGTRARRDVALRDRVQPEPVQTEQHPAVERARLGTEPRGFLRFFDHTPNKNARPIHTQMRRASKRISEISMSIILNFISDF